MAIKRVSSGRLTRVDQRRRTRQWRIIIGVGATAAVIAFVIVAVVYKTRTDRVPKTTPPPTAETIATASTAAPPPGTAFTAVDDQARTLIVNNTKVPQRFGNAIATLEQYNVAQGNAYRFEQFKPRLLYDGESAVYYRAGFEQPAQNIVSSLGASIPSAAVDVTVICGQDISKLILEAMAKKVPAPEGACVEVLNGCGIEGAGAKMKERLEANGYKVVAIGNAANFDYRRTVIEAGGGADNDAAVKVSTLFGLSADDIDEASYDIKIVIGDDYTAAPEQP